MKHLNSTNAYGYNLRSQVVSFRRVSRIDTFDGATTTNTGVTKNLCASAPLRLIKSTIYVWDNWNIIRETTLGNCQAVQPSNRQTDYVWGLDLDGTLQGAGGVGGLLLAMLHGTAAFYGYDAKGNVSQLVSADGELLAHYGYDPFGETVVSIGQLAGVNHLRFSTKPWDDLTGLGNWGYRWYDPGNGRWILMDPIEEEGFALARSSSEVIGHDLFPRCRKEAATGTSRIAASHGCSHGTRFPLESKMASWLEKLPRDGTLSQGSPAYVFVLNDPMRHHDLLGLDCPGCDAVGNLPGMGSDCALRCCAKHDECYYNNDCTAWSWGWIAAKLAFCSFFGIPWTECPLGVPVSACDECNISVVGCLVGCLVGIDPGGHRYYCAKQGKYINIPGDFQTIEEARTCCCN